MFYPGDPLEARKKALLAKLAGGRGRGAAGGMGVAHAPGFFGRGVGFGGSGMGIGGGIAHALSGYGQPQGPSANAISTQGMPPGFNLGNDVSPMPPMGGGGGGVPTPGQLLGQVSPADIANALARFNSQFGGQFGSLGRGV